MSLLGLTMDYGPFGFVDSYDGGFVANCSDGEGRYALAKQPDVRYHDIYFLPENGSNVDERFGIY